MDRKKRKKIIQKLIAKKKQLTDIHNRLMVSKGERVTRREELGVLDYQMQTCIYIRSDRSLSRVQLFATP